MTSILNWLTSWVTAEPMTVEQEHQHMSQLDVSEIDSGWNYVEGEQDYLLKLRFELDQEARKRELESIHFTTQKKNMGFHDRKIEFDELVHLLPEGSTVGLPVASIRYGIMKAVVEMEKSKWLECMKQIYSRHHSENNLWLDFDASFPQTQFSKGKQGSVIDFTLMSYSADPLSGSLLVGVLQSWNKCIQGFLEGELDCQLDTNDVTLLQTTLSRGIPRLIELHSKATRAVDTFQKMERLPSLWKAKEIEELEKKKNKTIDAKFEGQNQQVLPHERMTQPMSVLHSKINHIYDNQIPTPSVSISPTEHMSHSAFERTKESLEVLLEGTTSPATQKSEELD